MRGRGLKRGHWVTSSSRRSPREDYSVTRNGKKRLPTNTILSDSFSLLQPLFPWLPRPLLFLLLLFCHFFSPIQEWTLWKLFRSKQLFQNSFLSPNLGFTVLFWPKKHFLHSSAWSTHCIFFSTRQEAAVVGEAHHFAFFFSISFFSFFRAEQGSLARSSPP